jgi:hypothetical protein
MENNSKLKAAISVMHERFFFFFFFFFFFVSCLHFVIWGKYYSWFQLMIVKKKMVGLSSM